MTIVLAGGSGFLGRALAAHFSAAGHTVRTLSRRPRPGVPNDIAWQPDGSIGPWASALHDADVIVNLAGEGIADKRWNDARKHALRTSRVLPGRSLAAALAAAPARPRTLITSCAIGYYGAHGDEPITETTPPATDFLAALCVDWEREAAAAAAPSTHVAIVRSGIVLHPDGGALKSMLTPFRLGLGGPMGTGRQYMSWIHLDDWVALIGWLATTGGVPGHPLRRGSTSGHAEPEAEATSSGSRARTGAAGLTAGVGGGTSPPEATSPGGARTSPFDVTASADGVRTDLAATASPDGARISLAAVTLSPHDAHPNTSVWNGTAPTPVTNAEFSRTLGAVLNRPAVLPAPAFGLKLLLGEFANFLLTGARVIPAAAESAGFQFRFRELEPALRSLLQKPVR